MRNTKLASALASTLLSLTLAAPASAAPVEVTRTAEFLAAVEMCSNRWVDLIGTVTTVIKQNKDGTSTEIWSTHAKSTNWDNVYILNETVKTVNDPSVGYHPITDSVATLVSKGSLPNQIVRIHYDDTVWPPELSFTAVCRG